MYNYLEINIYAFHMHFYNAVNNFFIFIHYYDNFLNDK